MKKDPTKPLATVVSLIVALLVLRLLAMFLWPLLGLLVVLLFLVGAYKIMFKDRFY